MEIVIMEFINEQYYFPWSEDFLDASFDEFFYCECNEPPNNAEYGLNQYIED
jgi:hypothetical protein